MHAFTLLSILHITRDSRCAPQSRRLPVLGLKPHFGQTLRASSPIRVCPKRRGSQPLGERSIERNAHPGRSEDHRDPLLYQSPILLEGL
jgi:hypothetical protein